MTPKQTKNTIKTTSKGVLIADTPSVPLPFSIGQKASHSTPQGRKEKGKLEKKWT
jgi:hypothetical protein